MLALGIVVICTDFNFFVTTFIKFLLAFVRDTSFLTYFMLVQIFMGFFIFINSEVQINLITNFEMALIKDTLAMFRAQPW